MHDSGFLNSEVNLSGLQVLNGPRHFECNGSGFGIRIILAEDYLSFEDRQYWNITYCFTSRTWARWSVLIGLLSPQRTKFFQNRPAPNSDRKMVRWAVVLG